MKIHQYRPGPTPARIDRIVARVTETEREAIFAAARARGLSVSELVRSVAMQVAG